MAKKEPKSLFRRLTRLFKSGPVVKRKIRAIDTTLAVADKTKSSGTLLFQKSLSPTYATITSNAYNLSERLMRYQDFQEMEYSLAISTKIATPDGFKTIGELAEECSKDPNKTFIVYSYDHNVKRIVPALAKQARQTCVDRAWKVTFDNGKEIIASPEHRLMLRDGSYRRVEDLQPGDAMMPFYRKDLFASAKEGTKGYSWVYTMDSRFKGWTKEHQLIAEWVAGRDLAEDECVHHINFVKTDNRPENLKIMTKSDHDSYHAALNNVKKWAPENKEWIEGFKANHAQWMRVNAPTKRVDVTFARILETAERVGFSMPAIAAALDVNWNLVLDRLVANGFASFKQFVDAYAAGQVTSKLSTGRPGLLTRDMSLELIKLHVTENDTKRSLCIKLGCTVNVLDKFLNRRALITWSQLRSDLGYKDESVVTLKIKSVRAGGRPKGSITSGVTYKHVCDAYVAGITRARLASKLDVKTSVVMRALNDGGHKKWSDFTRVYENCKVVSVEYVGEIPLYDLTVDGYKNFATDSVISHNTPEIAAALDIYSDETWASDDKGRALHVYSDNEKIKEVLEDLFYNTLNVEFAGRSWVRNLPVRKDTVIPLLDGRNITIEQLAREHEAGKENWVYSVQDGTHRTVPGKVAWCGLTRNDSELVRVWLDDGTYVDCTPDHEWILRDGSQKRADALAEGESLMPFYRKHSSQDEGDRIQGYEQAYDASTDEFVYTHQLVARETCLDKGTVTGSRVIHHVDFNKHNNRPDNLREMDWHVHSRLHAQHAEKILLTPEVMLRRKQGADKWLRSDEHRALAKEQLKKLQARGLMKTSWEDYNSSPRAKEDNAKRSSLKKEMWADERHRARAQANMAIKFDTKCVDMVVERLEVQGKYVSPKVLGNQLKADEAFMGHFKAINEGTKRDLTKALNSRTGIESLLNKAGVASYIDLVKSRLPMIAATPWFMRAAKKSQKMSGTVPAMRSQRLNHKVAKVERLEQTSDVYCMEVLGPQGEHDRHNFMILTTSGEGLSASSGICSANCKYGDFFLFNDVSPEYGVVNAFPVPVNEIEREENYDRDDPFAVRYRWVTLGNRTLENWEVTHFRLLGNDMFLPYGSSVIEPARRIWRQLILIEDAMLVYRVVRAPERRVFYIDVANVPPENVPMYIEEQRRNLRTSQVIDNTSGRVDLRYNPLPMRQNTRVPLLDGRTLELHELAREYEAGKENWVYSIQKDTLKVVPGKVVWCGKNYVCDKIHRVWLDDGSYLDAAPEHPFVLRDGSPCVASKLQPGDSLMPLYTKISSKNDGNCIDGYPMFQENVDGKWVFLHRRVAEEVLNQQRDVVMASLSAEEKRMVVHHKDFDSMNSHPSNLQWMGSIDHWKYHASIGRERLIAYNKSPEKRARTAELNRKYKKAQTMGLGYNGSALHKEHNKNRCQAQERSWQTNSALRSQAMQWIVPNEVTAAVFMWIKGDPKITREQLTANIRQDESLMKSLAVANAGNKRNVQRFHVNAVVSKVERMGVIQSGQGYAGFRRFAVMNPPPVNHQVVRIDVLNEVDDVFCLTVHGPNGEHDRHTVAVQGQGGAQGVVFIQQSVDEDYFIPVRGSDTGTRIDTLAGGQNTAAVEDVAYVQKKLFAALKIPRAYLGYDELLCLPGDVRVPLLSGESIELHDLVAGFKLGKTYWVYSCDPTTGAIVPGRVTDAWKTKDVAELFEVVLDNGAKVRCTGNHPFLCRDGTYVKARDLQPDQPLMPLYRKLSSKKEGDFQNGYESVLDNGTNTWQFTHRVVATAGLVVDHSSRLEERSYVVHHVDHDKRNNDPSNLVKMGKRAHVLHHSTGAKANLLSDNSRDRLREVMKTDGYATVHREGVKHAWQNDDGTRRASVAATNTKHKRKDVDLTWARSVALACADRKEFYEKVGLTYTGFFNTCRRQGVHHGTWLSEIFGNKKLGIKRNHKVVSVTLVPLAEPVPVYDITVEGHHNFAVCGPGPQPDFQNCVIVSNSSKATLAQEDIRFSRTIAVIQKTMLAELNKLAIIHLYANGYDGEDLQNFTLRLSNPSTVAQQQKLELWRAKFEIGSSLPEGMGSAEFVQREIWGLSAEQIEAINRQRMKEKLLNASIEAASPEGGEAGGGGGGEDLFGGGGGGEEAGGGEEEAPPEENAGEEPEEETRSDVELLTSSDDQEDGEDFALKVHHGDGGAPVRPKNQFQKDYLYNRSRIQHHGPAKTHMPDFVKMTGNDSDAMKDPTDAEWMRSVVSNPFGEGATRPSLFGGLAPDVWSTLRRMTKVLKMNRPTSGGVISEGEDVQDEIDAGLELIDESVRSGVTDQSEVFIIDDDDGEPGDGDEE